ncbi:hypothetical protein MG293_007850 [Ovis ammon polii]|uniref:Ig-like domain-containing protein n=1 Tax=Ovis ammon polii TaxID=230172 RepID=A0AAD4YDH6_OVIAM|nr:hypothetical protein MG293_007850 [Ovis ammon polii]KAI4573780.1 hypothetical protein MJT46_005020 [Ovis ammon polii x Ovis aries]
MAALRRKDGQTATASSPLPFPPPGSSSLSCLGPDSSSSPRSPWPASGPGPDSHLQVTLLPPFLSDQAQHVHALGTFHLFCQATVRVFKRTVFKTAAALDSSSPKWWQAPELKQLVQALHRCQLLPPPAGTSLSRLLPPGLGLSITAELGLPNRPTVAGALAQLRPGPADVHFLWEKNGRELEVCVPTQTHTLPDGRALVLSWLRDALRESAEYRCSVLSWAGNKTSRVRVTVTRLEATQQERWTRELASWRAVAGEHDRMMQSWRKAWGCAGHRDWEHGVELPHLRSHIASAHRCFPQTNLAQLSTAAEYSEYHLVQHFPDSYCAQRAEAASQGFVRVSASLPSAPLQDSQLLDSYKHCWLLPQLNSHTQDE